WLGRSGQERASECPQRGYALYAERGAGLIERRSIRLGSWSQAERCPLVRGTGPVEQAEVEGRERYAAGARELFGPTLEQHRVADPEHTLGGDRDLVGAAERQR